MLSQTTDCETGYTEECNTLNDAHEKKIITAPAPTMFHAELQELLARLLTRQTQKNGENGRTGKIRDLSPQESYGSGVKMKLLQRSRFVAADFGGNSANVQGRKREKICSSTSQWD